MPLNEGSLTSNLRQFKCPGCPGKLPHHPYRLWYERVSEGGKSQCHGCYAYKDPIPRRQEEGVHICYFRCSCDRQYTVQCRMQDTAPCYGCRCKEVSPLYFKNRGPIRPLTNNTHNCSRCNGSGNCPNKASRLATREYS